MVFRSPISQKMLIIKKVLFCFSIELASALAALKEKKEDLLVDDQSQGSPFLVWLATYHLSYYLGPSDNWAPINRPVEIIWRLLLSVWYLFLIILCHLPWCSPRSQSWCWCAQSWWSSLRCWSRPRWRSPRSECQMLRSRHLILGGCSCWGHSSKYVLVKNMRARNW